MKWGEYKRFESLLFEIDLLKKGGEYLEYIKLDDEDKYANYNAIRIEKSKKRQKTNFKLKIYLLMPIMIFLMKMQI